VLNYLSYAEISVAQIYHHHALEGGRERLFAFVALLITTEEKIFPVFAKAAEEVC
jgi:hypothetical protein